MRKYWLIFKLIVELLILRLALREAFDDAPIFRRIKRRIKRRWFASNLPYDVDLAMRTKLGEVETAGGVGALRSVNDPSINAVLDSIEDFPEL